MESLYCLFDQVKLIIPVVCLQLGYAVMSILAKFALNKGMSQHVLVAYRMLVASALITPFAIILERQSRPKMTISIFTRIVVLSLLSPVLDQNLFYTGMKYTSATFTSAMCNSLPAFAFIMAWIFRLERVKIREVHCQVKILGTTISVGGAMLMTLVKGAELVLPWTRGNHHDLASSAIKQDPLKGGLMIIVGCFCWSCFIILQAITLRTYPAKLSLTALICITSAIEGTILALVVEGKNTAVWSIHYDVKLIAAVYGGIISGAAYYLMGVIVKKRGPVFMSAFNPLGTVFVTIMGVIFLAENLYWGRIFGAIVIVMGLYMVLWGKSKDKQSLSIPNNYLENPSANDLTYKNDIDVVDVRVINPVHEFA